MADKPKTKDGDLALIFGPASGGGSKAGAGDADDLSELGDELAGDGADEGDGADAPPPDFAVHAAEAFPELAGDDARLDALYRTIKACHPVV